MLSYRPTLDPAAPLFRERLLFVRHQAQLLAAASIREVAEHSLNEGERTTGSGTTSKSARRGLSRHAKESSLMRDLIQLSRRLVKGSGKGCRSQA